MKANHVKRTRSCCHECNVTLELSVLVNMGTASVWMVSEYGSEESEK